MAALRPEYEYRRQYLGPLKLAVCDWSGTVADKYVLAPIAAFVETFKQHKVPVTMAEARIPMGIRKDLHIKAILEMPSVRERWHAAHGRYPDDSDVKTLYNDFIPTQLACLHKYTELLPGCAQSIQTLKGKYNMKIGTSTGFVLSMSTILFDAAKPQGYEPDCNVAGDSVKHGSRPNPHMIYKNMDLLDVSPIQAVVKVDDCVSGLVEALEAGCWAVGVARYGNYMDIDSLEEEAALTEEEIAKKLVKAKRILAEGGAHYVIDNISDLPAVVEDINARLSRGEKP